MVDYNASAGLYPCKTVKRTSHIRYRRFDTVAEALRFAIEDLPPSMLRGSILEVDEARVGARKCSGSTRPKPILLRGAPATRPRSLLPAWRVLTAGEATT